MPRQAGSKRPETQQRPRTAPASHHQPSSLLDLGPLHQTLPRVPLLSHQNRGGFSSSTPIPRHQQANGQEAIRSLPFLQRATDRRPSTTESARRAPLSSPKGKGVSPTKGSRTMHPPTRWERPSVAESKKLFSENSGKGVQRKPGESQTLAGRGRKDAATKTMTEEEETPCISRLPIDLLCQCFVRIDSLFYLVNCASACRAWREVLLSDMIWKAMYLKWWQSMEVTECFDRQTREETQMPPHDTRNPPKGFDSWMCAFIARFQEGKKRLIVKEKAWAVREGYLGIRAEADRYGKRAFDCVQGDGMQKLCEHLGLSFRICLSRGRHIKIQGKGKIDIFQSSCLLRYPVAQIGNLNLFGLKSAEVTATSDRLLHVCPIVDFRCIAPGVSFIVGTLVETMAEVDEIDGKEQVLLIILSIHLNNLLWKLLNLGEGPTSSAARRILRDDLDPYYGLHNWHVSIQFHTFGRNIWTRTFKQVFWSQHESVPGEKAVLLLVSHHEVFPGILKLPWKGEAFSGSLRGLYLLDITLWDGGGEIAWQHTSVARINPTPLVVVEYGIDFDGEQVYTHILDKERGVDVAISLCIPMNVAYQQPGNERPMTAITNLHVGLTPSFLENWCGVANI